MVLFLGSVYKKVDSPLNSSDLDRKKQLTKKRSKQRSPTPEPAKKKNKKGENLCVQKNVLFYVIVFFK